MEADQSPVRLFPVNAKAKELYPAEIGLEILKVVHDPHAFSLDTVYFYVN
jgi:hypothetical protein